MTFKTKKSVCIVLTLVFCILASLETRATQANDHAKMGPRLYNMVVSYRNKQVTSAEHYPQEKASVEENMRIIVEARNTTIALKSLRSHGHTIEVTFGNLIQISVPLSAVEEIVTNPVIVSARLPSLIKEHAITSEGLHLSRIPSWHNRGLTGEGMKVAIIDSGFEGYDALLGNELPNHVTVRSFRQDGIVNGVSGHGTACAEIVHEIAPEAQMYLVNFETLPELGNASLWLIDQGIHILSCSVGFPAWGPDDGTGYVAEIVEYARANGILWVAAAGNDAQRHWSGAWRDDNGDGILDFDYIGQYLDDSMSIQAKTGDRIWAVLKWDDPWGASGNDYDMTLKDIYGNQVDRSIRLQTGAQEPLEEIQYIALQDGYYNLYISSKPGAQPATFHLFVPNHGLERWVEEGSLVTPASSPSAMTVGAADGQGPVRLEPFSSRGPTVDGRIKPDIIAPDRVTTSTINPFPGTSASAPHVAGAAALVKQLYPGYSPAEIQEFLEGRAIDLGPPGKEILFGAGILSLDPPRGWVVDDDGQQYAQADFTIIQDAIDASAPGDTISVYPGTYLENVKITRPVAIRGEGVFPDAVVIDRNESGRFVVEIGSPNCTLERVSVRNSAGASPLGLVFGIWLKGTDFNVIRNTIVEACYTGIYLVDQDVAVPPWWNRAPIRPEHNLIVGNMVLDNEHVGLHLVDGDNNVVRDNSINANNRTGAFIVGDRNCVVDNQISQNGHEGVVLRGNDNHFHNNLVVNNYWGGLILKSGRDNGIRCNTFRGNGCNGCSWPTPAVSIEVATSNLVCRNIFQEKVKIHAWDEYGTSLWDDGVWGNCWDDYAGEDQSGNGIGETAYVIPGDIPENGQDNFPVTLETMLATHKGDLTGDSTTGLSDAVFALRMLGGTCLSPGHFECISEQLDTNGDYLIGLAEVVYALQILAGVDHR